MRHLLALIAAALVAASPAHAQNLLPPPDSAAATPPPAAAPTPVESPTPSLLAPTNVDVRGTLDTDILLTNVMLGVAADLGMVRLRPGTLAVGAGLDYGVCVVACLVVGALLSGGGRSISLGQQHLFPTVRLSYHFPLPASSNEMSKKVDVYGLAFAGPVFSFWGLSSSDGAFRVEGSDVSVGVGGGLGAQYFFAERLFVGAEAAFRYARGRYTWRATAGSYTLSGTEDTWDLTGFNVRLNVGVRLF